MKRALLWALIPLAFACKTTTQGAEVRDAQPPPLPTQPPPLPPPLPTDLVAFGKDTVCVNHPYNTALAVAPTPAEKAAIEFYQGNGFIKINDFLRNPTKARPPSEADIPVKAAALLGVIAKQKPVPKTTPKLVLYRTFRMDAAPAVGSTFEAKGLLSTTFNDSFGDGERIFGFAPTFPTIPPKGHLAITMDIRGGAHGFVMNSLGKDSLLPKECELLISHGARFLVDRSVVKSITHKSTAGVPFTYEVTLQHWTIVNDGVAGAKDLLAQLPAPAGGETGDAFALDGGSAVPFAAEDFSNYFEEVQPNAGDASPDAEEL